MSSVLYGQLKPTIGRLAADIDEINERLTRLSFELSTDENGNVILVRADLEDLSEVSF